MTGDLRRKAEELLTLSAVRDAINTEYKRLHSALQAEYEQLGLERQRITVADGMDFGTIVLAAGHISVEITDREVMLEWLDAHHPTELVSTTVYDIRPAYWNVLVAAAKEAGVGVDPATGEVIPWIRVTVGDRSLRATPTRDAKQAVRQRLEGANVFLELEE